MTYRKLKTLLLLGKIHKSRTMQYPKCSKEWTDAILFVAQGIPPAMSYIWKEQ